MTLDSLQKTLGIRFHNQKLLSLAFVHRSYLNESKTALSSNERLEFLGDAVLSFLTSHYLFETYPDLPEGTLTNIRSSLVKTRSLGEAAKALSLGDLLQLSRGEEESGGRNNMSLLADCFEALLGAIFLDSGIETARNFLSDHIFPKAKDIIETKSYVDYKSLLQELVQEKSKTSPTYRVIRSEGPDHAKIFYMEAVVEGKAVGKGEGKSKQEAEQAAAYSALEKMGKT